MALVLPTLTAFTSSGLTAILTAKNEADFNKAFDALFASNVNITYNGKQRSREDYREQLVSQGSSTFEEKGASVSVERQLEVPGDKGQISGVVGLYYISFVGYKWLILGVPAESKMTFTFNAVIEATEPQPQSNPCGYFDPRRIVTVNQVTSDEDVNVTISAASISPSSPGVAVNPGGPIQLGPNP
ncbi:hypothetical protein BDR04DRAFT_383957 [Suillus decipiens]|nr:hypothetical protein BDR04DRAFT_383957 [Suillus decipiens]